MKNILVLTDFSIRADYAAKYALNIAQKIEADLILGHVIEPEKFLGDDRTLRLLKPDVFDLSDENKHMINELESYLQTTIIENKDLKDHKTKIKSVIKSGVFIDQVNNIIDENCVDFLIIGSRKSNSILRFIFGSKTHDLLDKIKCPVLLIPEGLAFKEVRSILYATDLPLNNKKALKILGDFARAFKAVININHISHNSFPIKKSENDIKSSLITQLSENYPEMIYHTVKSNDVTSGLLKIVKSTNIDVLVMVHRKYELLNGFLHKSLSKEMADKSFVPLLILPHFYAIDEALLSEDQLENFCFNTTVTR